MCLSVAGLATAPAAASACRSVAAVKAYQGHLTLGFDAHGGGADIGNGGTYSAQLKRDLGSLEIHLMHKSVIRNAKGTHAIFTGKASGGTVVIDDTFKDTGVMWTGKESYTGPLTNRLPDFGTAFLIFDLNKCSYQLEVLFNVGTTLSGNAPWSDPSATVSVSGTAYTHREAVPSSLKLSGFVQPRVWDRSCPGNPLRSGKSCYTFGGGLVGLCGSLDLVAANCGPSNTPADASVAWHLKPTFKKK